MHAGSAAIDMKHIKRDFSLIGLLGSEPLGWTEGMGTEAKIKRFSEYGHVAYQIIADNVGSNMVANILPTYTALT